MSRYPGFSFCLEHHQPRPHQLLVHEVVLERLVVLELLGVERRLGPALTRSRSIVIAAMILPESSSTAPGGLLGADAAEGLRAVVLPPLAAERHIIPVKTGRGTSAPAAALVMNPLSALRS